MMVAMIAGPATPPRPKASEPPHALGNGGNWANNSSFGFGFSGQVDRGRLSASASRKDGERSGTSKLRRTWGMLRMSPGFHLDTGRNVR